MLAEKSNAGLAVTGHQANVSFSILAFAGPAYVIDPGDKRNHTISLRKVFVRVAKIVPDVDGLYSTFQERKRMTAVANFSPYVQHDVALGAGFLPLLFADRWLCE